MWRDRQNQPLNYLFELQYVLLVSTFFPHYFNSVIYYRLLKQTANFHLPQRIVMF